MSFKLNFLSNKDSTWPPTAIIFFHVSVVMGSSGIVYWGPPSPEQGRGVVQGGRGRAWMSTNFRLRRLDLSLKVMGTTEESVCVSG